MEFGGPYDIDMEALPVRTVRRARLMLGLNRLDEQVVVVLDADREEIVRPESLPPGASVQALSADGRHLLLSGHRRPGEKGGLFLHTLETGQAHWFGPGSIPGVAWALSPDGTSIAALSLLHDRARPDDADATLARVSVVDMYTGEYCRLWQTPGGWSNETVLSWSPDGQLLAATYFTPDEQIATVVLDTAGTVVGHYDFELLRSPNNAWIADRDMVGYWHDGSDWTIARLTVPDGTAHAYAPIRSWATGRLGERLVTTAPSRVDDTVSRLITTNLDSTDPQPFITVSPPCNVLPFDTVRQTPPGTGG